MFTDANMQYVFQNGVLPDVMTPLGILLENACVSMSKPYKNKIPVVIWIKCLLIGFALESRISEITNIKSILIVTLIQSQSLFICFSYF